MLARMPKLCALLALALLPLAGAAQTTAVKLGDNAALRYWQAFEQLPKPSAATAKIFDADWDTIPFDTATLKILDEGATSLKLLHRGAMLERCDWGIDYE